MLNGNVKLYDELGELARYLESAMRKVSEVGAPMVAGSAQLPQATAHLLDLNKMTEEGTMEVMRLAEIIQDNRARAAKELAAVVSALEAVDCRTLATRLGKTANELVQDDKHLMESEEARHHRRGCSMQACEAGGRVWFETGWRNARDRGKGQ